jgi:hypothetical protein
VEVAQLYADQLKTQLSPLATEDGDTTVDSLRYPRGSRLACITCSVEETRQAARLLRM